MPVIQDRDQARLVFVQTWQKVRQGSPLQPMEITIADVIVMHPEYQLLLSSPQKAYEAESVTESGAINPFLHMGMHIALREQVQTDRPNGIVDLYKDAIDRFGDVHAAEHQMMECLGEVLWHASRRDGLPDESAYLACLRHRIHP